MYGICGYPAYRSDYPASIACFFAALAQALNGTPGSAVAHSVATVMRLCPSYILKRAPCAACTYLYGIVV